MTAQSPGATLKTVLPSLLGWEARHAPRQITLKTGVSQERQGRSSRWQASKTGSCDCLLGQARSCQKIHNEAQKMTIQALQDCLIVRPDMEKHELFILLREKQTGTGVVISAGPDAKDVKVGDKVLFGDSIGQDLKWEGDNLLVMRESHTLGVFDA